jgi:leader peptidase (prepilin peptidase)/N-methyltransferase
MEVLLGAIILCAIGAVIGSFLNVIIYRTEVGEDWVHGRSHCEECGKMIHWYDNIPIVSYLLLRGRCRYCKTSISPAHPIVEGLIGILFVWWWLLGSLFFQLTEQPFVYIQPFFWLAVGIVLVFIFVEDILTMTIQLWTLILLTILAVSYRFALVLFGVMRVADLTSTYIAALLITAFFYALSRLKIKGQQAMGSGDAILAFPLVILVGWPRAISWLFLSFMIGALVGIVLLIVGRRKPRQPIAFGPFMVAATFIALIWGESIWNWYIGLLY